MKTTFNKDQRSIRSRAMVTDNIAIELSTTWNKDRKYYLITVARLFVNDRGFQTLSIMEDMQTLDHVVPVSPRYSAKKLQEEHNRKIARVFNDDGSVIDSATAWAKDSAIAARELAK